MDEVQGDCVALPQRLQVIRATQAYVSVTADSWNPSVTWKPTTMKQQKKKREKNNTSFHAVLQELIARPLIARSLSGVSGVPRLVP